MIAQDAYPGLDVERYLGDIERMAIRLRARMPQNRGAEERVVALNQFLYEDAGLLGQHRRLLRSAQQLSQRGDRPPDRHPDHPGDPLHGARPAHRPAARGRVVSRAISWCACKLRGGTLVLDPFSGGAPQSEDELRQPREARDSRRRGRRPARRRAAARPVPRAGDQPPDPGARAAQPEGHLPRERTSPSACSTC